MSSEWQQTTLGALTVWSSGGTPKKDEPKFWGGDIPWISASSMHNTRYSDSDLRLTPEGLRNGSRIAPNGSVLLLVRGSSLHSRIPVGMAMRDLAFNQDVKALVPKNDDVRPWYLLYWLMGKERYLLDSVVEFTGIGAGKLDTNRMQELEFLLPSIYEQDAIVGVIKCLDDRITLLRETNATLEAIAQALFKSWFVDFDPVYAKQQGRAPEGMDEATAALFPDGFEESELGLVPKGWRVEWLSDVFDFKEGPGIRNWQYTNSEQGTRFINIRCIQGGDLSIETANRITDEEANGKYAHFNLQAWDVVVSTSGTLGRSAIVRKEHLPLMLNTSVIRFQPVQDKTAFCFVYEYLNAPEFLYKLESMASGSVQKNFGPMHLKQIKLVCPPFELVSHYEIICRPLFEKLVANRSRIDVLSTLRDTLLPRLISGQLRLPEAEAMLAEA